MTRYDIHCFKSHDQPKAILNVVLNLALIPVLTFYLLRDWDNLVAYIADMIPRPVAPTVNGLAKESDQVLGAFLKGQFVVMLCLGIIYSAGLLLIGLKFSLLFGMIAGLVSFVPYLGFILGVVFAGVAAVFQFQDFLHPFLVLVVFAVGQGVEGTLLTPFFVGGQIGLHPVAVIFAVLVGGYLFGFFGILLALPVAAISMVLLRRAYREYRTSSLYQ